MIFGTVSALVSGGLTYNMFKNLNNRVRLENVDPELLATEILSSLTLAIPARDELVNLKALLPQIADQSPRPAQVLVLDDKSTDGTTELLNEWSSKKPWIKRIEGEELPNGWRGKVWALHQLLKKVETEYVLFLDADVRLNRSTAIASLWQTAQRRNFGFLSVFPRAEVGLGASMLVHQIYTHLYYFLPFNAEKLPNASAVAGCGQVMLVRADDLRALGGLGRLRSSTHDGLRLARIFKQDGRAVVAVDGSDAFSCLMYKDFRAAFRGFSRNSYEATNSVLSTLAISALLFWVFVLPFVLFPLLIIHPAWLVAFLMMLYGQYRIARELELGMSHVALTPAKALASIGVHLWGATRAQLKIGTNWRGRVVT